MHVTLIVNPYASSITPRVRVMVTKLLSRHHEVTEVETTRGGHGMRLAYSAINRGTDLVVAFGGDGTINEVANGALGHETPIAPLPGGSTNVFARCIGYPNDPIEASSTLLASIEDNSIKQAGIGMANQRAFLLNLGAGFDASVVTKVERRGSIKRYLSHPLFIASAIETWLEHENQSSWFEISSSTKTTQASAAVALNANPYTYLGNRPIVLAPEANLNQPLSIVGFKKLKLPNLLTTLAKAITTDKGIPDQGQTFHWADTKKTTINGHKPFPYQLDGEPFRPVDDLVIEHIPRAIPIVSPKFS